MNAKNRIISLCICAAIAFTGCSRRESPPSPGPASDSSSAGNNGPEAAERSREPEPPFASYDEITETYYDYVAQNGHICMLLGDEPDGEGFSDSEMAAYAIGELAFLGVYDYENGHAREEFDAITEKYFGKHINNFENSKSTVLPTGNITSTGWGGSGIYMVLKELHDEEGGSKTAVFYQISVGMGEGLPAPERLKRELLSGNLGEYGTVWLTEMRFEEKRDEEGNLYFKYIDITPLGMAEGPFAPYSAE